ncbi:MAG: SDR family oxidoreductase [Herbiconiux sp.]|nr:SDR family oxidoreductase [Herbiconiux sp.]
MRIAVAGGTGTIGTLATAAARSAGHEPVVLSRATGVDLLTGAGLPRALDGVEAVVDVTGTSSTATRPSVHFFGTVTLTLLDAERTAGVPHHVALSVIGATAIDASYYAGKATQERLLRAEKGGWSLLRTAQFHEFAEQLLRRGRVGPVQVVPSLRSQPIAASEVATELVRIAASGPQGLVPDLAGPREECMADLVRQLLRATGRRRPVVQVPLPGAWGRGLRDGSLLAGPDARRGRQTFAEWLHERRGAEAR